MGGTWRPDWRFVAWAMAAMLLPAALLADPPRIAIVIDDLGYLAKHDREVLELDWRIAVAIIPDGPLAPALSRKAALQQRDVLIHLPLSGMRHDNCDFGATCPDPGWSPMRMAGHLRWASRRVENAIGINNHQGSRFTADQQAVENLVGGITLLDQLHQQPLFVLDSRTTPRSQLERKAASAGLATTRRNVFLDHDRCPDAIEKAWQQLLALARRDGSAVAIGHPHPETIDFLYRSLPELANENIELVPISQLVAQRKAVISDVSPSPVRMAPAGGRPEPSGPVSINPDRYTKPADPAANR